jgi:hypothetical protein
LAFEPSRPPRERGLLKPRSEGSENVSGGGFLSLEERPTKELNVTIVQLIELAERFDRIAALDAGDRDALKAGQFDGVDQRSLALMVRWLADVEKLSGNDEDLGDTVGPYLAAASESLRRRGQMS